MRYNDNALAQHIKPRHLPIDFRTIMQHTIKIKSIKINKQTEYREKVSATSQNKTDIFLIRDDKYIEYKHRSKHKFFLLILNTNIGVPTGDDKGAPRPVSRISRLSIDPVKNIYLYK